mgnify:CR=1 FL=1
MKKRAIAFIALFLCAALFFCLSACNNAENNARDNEMDEIYIGTPATELSRSEQNFYANYIADYTECIKFAFCEFYKKTDLSFYTWTPTIIVDKFYIYDFSQVNLETLTEEEKYTFEQINNVIDNCQMIICCNGYWNFYSENTWIPSEASARIPDMFISNDQFHQSRLLSLFGAYYAFNLPKETRILDFGSEYAFRYQPTYEEAVSFIPQYKTVTPVTAE